MGASGSSHSQVAPREAPKGAPRKASNGAPRKASSGVPREALRKPSNGVPREALRKPSNGALRKVSHGAPRSVPCREAHRESPKWAPREAPSSTPREGPRKTSKAPIIYSRFNGIGSEYSSMTDETRSIYQRKKSRKKKDRFRQSEKEKLDRQYYLYVGIDTIETFAYFYHTHFVEYCVFLPCPC